MKNQFFHNNTYKLVRSYKLSKQKINEILYKDQPILRSGSYGQIKSTALVIYHNKKVSYVNIKEFEININNNNLCIYDKSVYFQTDFNNVFDLTRKKQFWAHFQKNIKSQRNYVLFYLQSSKNNQMIFLNNEILNKSILEQQTQQLFLQELGIVERAMKSLALKLKKQQNQELLVSVIGFSGDIMVDLLNFETDKKSDLKLKIKKQEKNIVVQNLTQIGVEDLNTFLQTFSMCTYLKNLYESETGNNIQAEIYQICISKLSSGKQKIEKIKSKYNFVRLHRQDLGLKSSIGNCLKGVINGVNNHFIPARNSKLTFFLEDCLNTECNIEVLYEIDNSQNLKSQIQNLTFNNNINKKVFFRKNYFYDDVIVGKLKKNGSENTIIQKIQKDQTEELRRNKIKIVKFGEKYDIKLNRSILAETLSSLHKRKSKLSQRKNRDRFNLSNISIQQKCSLVKNAYNIKD